MTETVQKFMPAKNPETEAFWKACQQRRLLIQHCSHCDHYQFYPRSLCVSCGQRDPEWFEASGRGKVESWTVVRTPVSPAYAELIPYVIALIRLEEGPCMMGQLRDCDVESVQTGMAVTVVFEDWSEQVTMPLFKPAANQTAG
jgi:uncharacterized OB-fold protein